jgi:archaeal chaperonin
VVEYPHVLVGGGAPEALASMKLREWASTLSGRSQLAVEKFADGIETIPIVLAENAGMDPLDTQVQLRSKSTGTGKARYGIDVMNGKVADLAAKDIYEPLAVKEQVINAATEAACMILRIDDVIAASKPRETPKPGSGPSGMGGMGDMDM